MKENILSSFSLDGPGGLPLRALHLLRRALLRWRQKSSDRCLVADRPVDRANKLPSTRRCSQGLSRFALRRIFILLTESRSASSASRQNGQAAGPATDRRLPHTMVRSW